MVVEFFEVVAGGCRSFLVLVTTYPTIFDPTKAKNSTSACSKRLGNRKRRCAEQQ